MIIKSINNVIGYKGIPDGFKMDFDEKLTYIIGDNAKTKSTILEIPFYTLTGYNLNGSDRDNFRDLRGPDIKNVVTDITIIDNEGRLRNIIRSKGKDNYILIDGIKTTQKELSVLFDNRNVHIFTCAYNPYYFRSLEQAEQRELLIELLPAISAEESFNLLDSIDKEIIEKPIIDVIGYCKEKRRNNKELNSEIKVNEGKIEIYQKTALMQEGEMMEFQGDNELEDLKNQYENLLEKSDSNVNLSELEVSIKSLESRLNDLLKVQLIEIKNTHLKETEHLNSLKSSKSICPQCKQEVKNEATIERLTLSYKKNIEALEKKMNDLKTDAKNIMELRKNKIEQYKKLKTPEMQKRSIKERIQSLEKDKEKIDANNKEVELRRKAIKEAKNMLDILYGANIELQEEIDKNERQIKVADRLKRITIESQLAQVKQYLDNVTIEFSHLDETTGEIKDVYIVKYKGVEYKNLSKSYKMRADFEIANLIIKATKIYSPMVIDDAESITKINSTKKYPDCLLSNTCIVKVNDDDYLSQDEFMIYSDQPVLPRHIYLYGKKHIVGDKDSDNLYLNYWLEVFTKTIETGNICSMEFKKNNSKVELTIGLPFEFRMHAFEYATWTRENIIKFLICLFGVEIEESNFYQQNMVELIA